MEKNTVTRTNINCQTPLTLIGGDLSLDSWASSLSLCGFSKEIPTIWILEGIIMYLEEKQAQNLLRSIFNLSCSGSRIILHTVNSREIQNQQQDNTHHASDNNIFSKLDATMKFGTDNPSSLLKKSDDDSGDDDGGKRWKDVETYEYDRILEELSCKEYLINSHTDSSFTCALLQ
eukprot:TRINITY_DN18053_c0_g1_i1.p1 TRINITY_DN18053_c0_g1~~TRINITY_DN18053_c0_g1_i1.p1  ORF type:complete len:175 (-),score=45.69 TRINITY_DN18053_c0_g1_i1:18-542(-)